MDALASLSFFPLRFSKNPVAYTIDAAPDSIVMRADLSYILSLKKPKTYGSGEYNELITLPGRELPKRSELGADVWPGAMFDAGVFLDDYLKRTAPAPDQTSIVTCGDMITPYLVQTRVENAGVIVPGTTQTLPLEYAMKGGLSVEQFAGWRDQFFTKYLSDSRRFLTWHPAAKTVEIDQPEFLYYLVNCTPKPTELWLRADVTYGDGSTESLTIQKMTVVSRYTVYSIPVGFAAMGLPAREAATSKTVHSYQVWLSNEAALRLSEVRTYYVNHEYEANTLFLLFANSLGGYDTLRCIGQSNRTLTVKGTAAQRALVPNYLPSTAEVFSLNRLGEKTLTVATGLRDGDHLDYLSELTLTDEIYVVTQEGFVALVPSDAALNLRTDDEDLAGRVLSYRYAKNEVGYSDLPSAPATPARATMWVPVNTFCLIGDSGLRTGYLGAAKLELRYVDDGSRVKPLRSKANTPGTEGYTAPILTGVCSTTPFVNALIQKAGTYRRNNCGVDQESTVATLTIAAGTYGAETADQLQSRIDAALKTMDTQDYANLYGSCLANPALYTYTVPDGQFHVRSNVPSRIAMETSTDPYMGNSWSVQGRGSSGIYPTGSNDLNFSLPGFNLDTWLLFTYGTAYKSSRLRVYRNGVLFMDKTFTFNQDNLEQHALFAKTDGGYATVSSKDRFYIQLTDS